MKLWTWIVNQKLYMIPEPLFSYESFRKFQIMQHNFELAQPFSSCGQRHVYIPIPKLVEVQMQQFGYEKTGKWANWQQRTHRGIALRGGRLGKGHDHPGARKTSPERKRLTQKRWCPQWQRIGGGPWWSLCWQPRAAVRIVWICHAIAARSSHVSLEFTHNWTQYSRSAARWRAYMTEEQKRTCCKRMWLLIAKEWRSECRDEQRNGGRV